MGLLGSDDRRAQTHGAALLSLDRGLWDLSEDAAGLDYPL
jgi:hypothetical protein